MAKVRSDPDGKIRDATLKYIQANLNDSAEVTSTIRDAVEGTLQITLHRKWFKEFVEDVKVKSDPDGKIRDATLEYIRAHLNDVEEVTSTMIRLAVQTTLQIPLNKNWFRELVEDVVDKYSSPVDMEEDAADTGNAAMAGPLAGGGAGEAGGSGGGGAEGATSANPVAEHSPEQSPQEGQSPKQRQQMEELKRDQQEQRQQLHEQQHQEQLSLEQELQQQTASSISGTSGMADLALEANPPVPAEKETLRQGKWTPEEEAYVAKIIANFSDGTLPAEDGTTLRTYLSEKLNCDPMRITKKFAGDLAIGRRVFSRMLPTAENEATIAESQKLLAELEAAWLAKLEEMRLEAERVDASNQQQQPNNDPHYLPRSPKRIRKATDTYFNMSQAEFVDAQFAKKNKAPGASPRSKKARGGGGGGGPSPRRKTSEQHPNNSAAAAAVRQEEAALRRKAVEATHPELIHLEHVKVFRPSPEEWADPAAYLRRASEISRDDGICKIVPPASWRPPPQFTTNDEGPLRFPTTRQRLSGLFSGCDLSDGAEYSLRDYKRYSERLFRRFSRRAEELAAQATSATGPQHDATSSSSSTTGNSASHEDRLRRLEALYWRAVHGEERHQPRDAARNPHGKNGADVNQHDGGIGGSSGLGFGGGGGDPELREWECIDYANDLDNDEFWSGFPRRLPGDATSCCRAREEQEEQEQPPEDDEEDGAESSKKMDEEEEEPSSSEDAYRTSGWNLNNVARLEGSLLRHLPAPGIGGVTLPWIYFGVCFASFCWHNEDNWLASLNYLHRLDHAGSGGEFLRTTGDDEMAEDAGNRSPGSSGEGSGGEGTSGGEEDAGGNDSSGGAPKQWYAIPVSDSAKFRDTLKRVYPALFRSEPDVLNKLKVQVSPWLLREHDVTVKACVQYPGEFVLTVPQAYHCGFSYGFNCGEAVNFAPVEWLADGSDAARTYRLTNRPPPFSHERLVLTVAARAAAAVEAEERVEEDRRFAITASAATAAGVGGRSAAAVEEAREAAAGRAGWPRQSLELLRDELRRLLQRELHLRDRLLKGPLIANPGCNGGLGGGVRLFEAFRHENHFCAVANEIPWPPSVRSAAGGASSSSSGGGGGGVGDGAAAATAAAHGVMDFDDLRQCAKCKALPFMSSVICCRDSHNSLCVQCACESLSMADPTDVATAKSVVQRTHAEQCSCPWSERFLITWVDSTSTSRLIDSLCRICERTSLTMADL